MIFRNGVIVAVQPTHQRHGHYRRITDLLGEGAREDWDEVGESTLRVEPTCPLRRLAALLSLHRGRHVDSTEGDMYRVEKNQDFF